jgi:hypothetical protein
VAVNDQIFEVTSRDQLREALARLRQEKFRAGLQNIRLHEELGKLKWARPKSLTAVVESRPPK